MEQSSSDGEEDTIILDNSPSPLPERRRLVKKEKAAKKEVTRKQFVQVDRRGHPHGKSTDSLIKDVRAFAKGLNPCYGWADQPLDEKQRFFDRLYAGNDFH
jgi:hypothetical protein